MLWYGADHLDQSIIVRLTKYSTSDKVGCNIALACVVSALGTITIFFQIGL